MQYPEVLERILARAGVRDPGEAADLVRAVLTALEERTTPGLARNLRSQLPEELKAAVPEVPGQALGGGADAFLRRVVDLRGRATPPQAVRGTLDVLREAVSPGQIENLLGQLPEDLDRLVGGPGVRD